MNIKNIVKLNVNTRSLILGIPAIAFLITAAVFYYTQNPQTQISSIGKTAIEYINKNLKNSLLGGQTASFVNATEESGLVKIKLDLGGTQYDSYVTKDGKLFFTQAIPMTPVKPKESKKADNPVLDAFIVSRCPYGLQMQRILADVIKNIPSLGQYVKVRYIGAIADNKLTSMHGEEEATENLRQICIREEQGDKYWDYVSCQMKAGDTAGCEKSTGIDSAKLNSCMSDANKGLAYAKVDTDLTTKYGVSGSPTLILNEETTSESDFGGRTSEALKALICSGFNNKPDACSTELTTEEAAPSFSETYTSTNPESTNANGGCGS